MINTIKPIIIGNWKMHGIQSDILNFINIDQEIIDNISKTEIIICPPATLISSFIEKIKKNKYPIKIGSQNCYFQNFGSYTGEISAKMFADTGVKAILVGHSERKKYFFETCKTIYLKIKSIWNANLLAILCIGDTYQDYINQQSYDVIIKQLDKSLPNKANLYNTVIAYEPIWAIGNNSIASISLINKSYQLIRNYLIKRYNNNGK